MKKLVLALLSGLIVLIGSGAVFAQTVAIRANVPFAFSAGTTQFPAGLYIVRTVNGSHSLMLAGENREVFIPVLAGQQITATQHPALTFNHYGRRYFLSQIWFTPEGVVDMPKSNLELRLASRPGVSPQLAAVSAQ